MWLLQGPECCDASKSGCIGCRLCAAHKQLIQREPLRHPTYQVNVEQGAQDFATLGKGAEHFRGGEGGVQEKAASHSVEAFPQERWKHQQVIVMNPDIVLIHGHLLYELIRKGLHQECSVLSGQVLMHLSMLARAKTKA